jgi:hypothetical protein
MTYSVLLLDSHTGERRRAHLDGWDDHSEFMWSDDGNYGCDCNRELVWHRVTDPEYGGDDEVRCGTPRFKVLEFTLEDGTIIPGPDADG